MLLQSKEILNIHKMKGSQWLPVTSSYLQCLLKPKEELQIVEDGRVIKL